MNTETHASPRFIVDPREGTVAGPGGTVRLEPKVMDVLAVLGKRPGRVISRDELLIDVWSDVFVTEHTLTRCIYQLRNKLGKIGAKPGQANYNPIETLPKRGYRLLAALETLPAEDCPTSRSLLSNVPPFSFVVGQWVRGDRFYGRAAQVDEILGGYRNCIWILGTRRIGKTSLLKQLEYIAETSPERRYFPIFWDFQGAETPEDLHLNFADALMDAEEGLERIGIGLEDVVADDLFVSLERLRRRLRAKKLRLLLLCDEVEELIKLHRKAPSLLNKLRHMMQSREDIRSVLASTIRLWVLADQKEDTSPFLHGFAPPIYIERLSDEETQSLITQSNLGPGQRPNIPDDVVEAIQEHCDNHPYLVQLVCKRYLEAGELKDTIEQVATDRMASYFFSVDFEMLSDAERGIVRMIARRTIVDGEAIGEEISLGSDAHEGSLRRLENLGFIRREKDRNFILANYFFRRWLRETHDCPRPVVNATPLKPTMIEEEIELNGIGKQSAGGLVAEMTRRSVFRVGIAYLIVAWFLLQLGEIAFDFLEVPAWAGKLLIVFLTVGLPVALILAWAFELTPEGLKRESDVD